MTNRSIVQCLTKRGFVLDAFAEDAITREIQQSGEYDSNTLDALVEILQVIQPQTALDVGANIGNHSVLIAQYVKRLIAFEPVPFIYAVLKQNLAHQSLSHAQAVPLALSDDNATHTLHILNNGNLGTSSLEVNENVAESIDIQTVIGDEWLATHTHQPAVDFIKMDVEGHEVSALLGLQKTILKHQPLLLLEWKSAAMKARFFDEKLFQALFNGYQCFALSYTTNKKAHPKTFIGKIQWLVAKLKGKQWCLQPFVPQQHYANVFFVPQRHLVALEKYLPK